jgi:hypothetical protein
MASTQHIYGKSRSLFGIYQNIHFSEYFQSANKSIETMHDMIAFIASQISYDISSDDNVLDLIGDQFLTGAQLDAIFILIHLIKKFEQKLVEVMTEACDTDQDFYREVNVLVVKKLKLDTTFEAYTQIFIEACVQILNMHSKNKTTIVEIIQYNSESLSQTINATFSEWDSLAQSFYPELSQTIGRISSDPEYVDIYLDENRLVNFDYDAELASYHESTNMSSADLDVENLFNDFGTMQIQTILSDILHTARANNLEFHLGQKSHTMRGLIDALDTQYGYDFWKEFIMRFEHISKLADPNTDQCVEAMFAESEPSRLDWDDLLSKLKLKDVQITEFPVEMLFRILSEITGLSTYVLDANMDVILEIFTLQPGALIVCYVHENTYVLLQGMQNERIINV